MLIRFLGGAGTVTGSKFLVEVGPARFLVDCGLFQGLKALRLRNRERFAVPPESIDAVILTHAHIDHSGYLPLLVRDGFRGPVYATAATRDLCGVLLPDSGHLQEEEAEYANRKGFSKHHPALPLYTQKDAEECLKLIVPAERGRKIPLKGGTTLELFRAGHILGASMARLTSPTASAVFTGDLGRPNDLTMRPPDQLPGADALVIESTYGDRTHSPADPLDRIEALVKEVARRGSVVIVPAFAVGRAQTLLYLLYLLKRERRIPDVPIFLNSPMATRATELFRAHSADHRLSTEDAEGLCNVATCVADVEESKALNLRHGPMIIISASGMATGGRVLHHLKAFVGDPANIVLFTGYQAAGTRGEAMLRGVESIKIHGEYYPVRARVENLDTLSAHADSAEILAWLEAASASPKRVFVVHGEPASADRLRLSIEERFGWTCEVPDHGRSVEI